MSDFDKVCQILSVRGDVLAVRNLGARETIVVLGESHFVVHVQYNLLLLLEDLYRATHFSLLGAEGPLNQFSRIVHSPDYLHALHDLTYFRKLLESKRKKLNAARIFAAGHLDQCASEAVEDEDLRKVALIIDQRCATIYLREDKSRALTAREELEDRMWLALLREVVLGARSDLMVQRLYAKQREIGAELAVLNCGLAHTPAHPAYEPYSVLRTLNTLPVNYVVALPQGCEEAWASYLSSSDPFNFYSKIDDGVTNPFETKDPYAQQR